MMKKNAIALSVAALVGGLGFAGGASADVIRATNTDATDIQVNPGGIGHSLLFPYYTTQNGNSTLLNIVNTDTVNGKAVKVRFRGASNSDDVFDFQLFLSPGDVWTANVNQGPDGRSRVTTGDKSCTLPASVNQSFVLDRLPAQIDAAERANQTREGYVEIFTMANVPPTGINIDPLTPGSSANRLFTAIKHVNGVPPCTTSALNRLTTNPTTELGANGLGLSAPTTGLFGNFSIINMNDAATSWTGEATSLVAVRATSSTNNVPVPGIGNIVFFPQTAVDATTPNLFTADPVFRTANVSFGAEAPTSNPPSLPVVRAQLFDLPDMSTPYLFNQAIGSAVAPLDQARQLSQAIARLSIKNEILTDTAISAATDWLISTPTRRYSVAVDYRANNFYRIFSNLNAAGTTTGNEYFTASNTALVAGQVCVAVGSPTVYDREETFAQSGFVISPGTAVSVRFCGEVSVLSFNAGSNTANSVLSARVARQNLQTDARDGWADLPTPGLPATSGLTGASPTAGLPILGRAFVKATNPAIAANKSANFGGSWEHRFTKPETGQ